MKLKWKQVKSKVRNVTFSSLINACYDMWHPSMM